MFLSLHIIYKILKILKILLSVKSSFIVDQFVNRLTYKIRFVKKSTLADMGKTQNIT